MGVAFGCVGNTIRLRSGRYFDLSDPQEDQFTLEDIAGGLRRADSPAVDWVIIGGESGPNARPCNIEWIRSIVRLCRAAGVLCFVKQLGSQPIEPDGAGFVRHAMLRDTKGGDPSEWPEDLRIREIPE